MSVAAPLSHRFFAALLASLISIVPALVAADPAVDVAFRPLTGATGALAVDLQSGKEIFSHNADLKLKPASILKLAITYAALKEFGPDYTFATDFYISGKGTDRVLTVRGGGDPTLTNESMYVIAHEIAARGVSQIRSIVLDNSLFVGTNRSGARAYESAAHPLTLNFNSIRVWGCRGIDGVIRVGADPDSYAPQISAKVGSGKESILSMSSFDGPGKILTVTGTLSAEEPCVSAYRSVPNVDQYFGTVFRDYLLHVGIKVSGTVEIGKAPSTEPFYTFRSKPLIEIVTGLNHFSTNMIAESLLYLLGRSGDSASRDAGMRKLSSTLQSIGIESNEYALEDASGLSHDNQITVRAIAKILRAGLSDPTISAEYASSLSILGRSGTLKRRDSADGEIFMRGKTGSLDGVSSLAGTLITKRGAQLLLVLIENQVKEKGEASDWEDKIVRDLYRTY